MGPFPNSSIQGVGFCFVLFFPTCPVYCSATAVQFFNEICPQGRDETLKRKKEKEMKKKKEEGGGGEEGEEEEEK